MKNTYLTSIAIEELEQREEFTAVDGIVSCAFSKCVYDPTDESYLF